MDQYQDTCVAVQGVIQCAGSLRLANCIGSERARELETQATNTLLVLTSSHGPIKTLLALNEAAELVCQLASACIALVDAVNLDLAANMMECFDQVGLIIWGFSVDVAEIISFSLAAVASLLRIGSFDMSIPSHRFAKRSQFSTCLEVVLSDLDCISMQIYGGLCRFDVDQGGSSASSEESRLVRAFQSICVWTLAILYHFEGSGQLQAALLWEWASSDPLWALVLARGVLCFQPGDTEEIHLLLPDNLAILKEAVTGSVLGLHGLAIAFSHELEANIIADDLDGGFPMAHRIVGLDLHRARLALAVVDCNLIEALLGHLLAPCTGMGPWLPALVSFLAALSRQPQGDAAAWAQVAVQDEAQGCGGADGIVTLADAQGVADALAAEASGHSHSLWGLLMSVPPISGSPGFFWDCAILACAVPAPAEQCRDFIHGCFFQAPWADLGPSSLAALCLLAANCCVEPQEPLSAALAQLTPEAKASAARHLARRAPLNSRSEVLLPLWGFCSDAKEDLHLASGVAAPETSAQE
ncbi:unnamed protein product, partial [Polarella glacialis]